MSDIPGKYQQVSKSDRSKLIPAEDSWVQSNRSIPASNAETSKTNLPVDAKVVVFDLPENAKSVESQSAIVDTGSTLSSSKHVEVALISHKKASNILNSDSTLSSSSSSVDDSHKPPISRYRDYSILLCIINPMFAVVGLCMLSEAEASYNNGDPKAAIRSFHSAKATLKWGLAFTICAMVLPAIVFSIYFFV